MNGQPTNWQPSEGLEPSEGYRLPVKPVEPSRAVSNWLNGYVQAFNRRNQRSGGLFEDRFGRKPIAAEEHLTHLVAYIHRNPERHDLVDDFRHWRYSSYSAIVSGEKTRIKKSEVLAWFGGLSAFVDAHQTEVDDSILAL